MSRDKYFIIFISGFVFATFLCSFFNLGFTFGIFLFFVSFLSLLFFKIYKDPYSRVFIIGFFILVLSFGVGIIRYEFSEIARKTDYSNLISKKEILEGIVLSEPDTSDQYQKFVLTVNDCEEKCREVKIIVQTDPYPRISYGDKVSINGNIESTDTMANYLSGYKNYLAKDGIYLTANFVKTNIISSGNGNKLKNLLIKVKNSSISEIKSQLVDPQSSLLIGMLLGTKTFSDELNNNFRKAGLSHIVVLSGYNITIVAESVLKIFSFLPKNFALGFSAIGIILFTVMVGGTSTVIRASIMALILIIGRVIYRDYNIGRSLFVAGFIMVLINPKILVFDVSFQLSFLATLALIYLSPIISSKLKITDKFGLREIVASTLATQFFVLPLLIVKMDTVSVVSIFTNLFVLPLVPTIMFLGFVLVALGFISRIFAWPFMLLSWILLSFVLLVVNLFSSLPISAIPTNSLVQLSVFVIYILFGIWFVFFRYQNIKIIS